MILRALTDPAFRRALIEHGSERTQCFSWERSARAALDAIARAGGQGRDHVVADRVEGALVGRHQPPAPWRDLPSFESGMFSTSPIAAGVGGVTGVMAQYLLAYPGGP